MRKQIVERFIFFPEKPHDFVPEDFNMRYKDVYFQNEDNAKLHGWMIFAGESPREYPTMLFFHGNAGNISHRLENVDLIIRRGINVFIMDYQGYGKSEGRPSENGTYIDAFAAYKYIVNEPDIDPDKLVIFGRSLGGAVAIDLASKNDGAKALIVESTFTNTSDLAGLILPVAGDLIAKDIYNSLGKANKVKIPMLQFHGTEDELIPFSIGQKLFKGFNEPKEFFPIKGATHNDTYLIGGTGYFDKIKDFIYTHTF